MFLIGVACFTAASAFCGFAPSIEWLIAARVLQGSPARSYATGSGDRHRHLPPHERGQAFSLFGLSAGLAAVCGRSSAAC